MKNCFISENFVLLEDKKKYVFYSYNVKYDTVTIKVIKNDSYLNDMIPQILFKYNYQSDIITKFIIDDEKIDLGLDDLIIQNEDEYKFYKISDEIMKLYYCMYCDIHELLEDFELNDLIDYSISDENKQNYINSNLDENKNLAKLLMDNMYLLSFSELVEIYKNIIKELKQTKLRKSYVMVFNINDIEHRKSSYYFSLVFLYLSLLDDIVFSDIWISSCEETPEKYYDLEHNPNKIYVIVDDVSYSGNQMRNTLFHLNLNTLSYVNKKHQSREKKIEEEKQQIDKNISDNHLTSLEDVLFKCDNHLTKIDKLLNDINTQENLINQYIQKYIDDIEHDELFLINSKEYNKLNRKLSLINSLLEHERSEYNKCMNIIEPEIEYEENLSDIVIATSYISKTAFDTLSNVLKTMDYAFLNIVIPKSSKVFSCVGQLIEQHTHHIQHMHPCINKHGFLFCLYHQHLLYTSWKLPDEMSFPQQLIGLGIPIHIRYDEELYVSNINKFLKKPLIDNCSYDTIKEKDNLAVIFKDTDPLNFRRKWIGTTCPYTFYKFKSFTSYSILDSYILDNYQYGYYYYPNDVLYYYQQCLYFITKYMYGKKTYPETIERLDDFYYHLSRKDRIYYGIENPISLLNKLLS